MLKNTEVYDVTITLNDGKALSCLLLSKPDAATLVAIAEQRKELDVVEAVAFAHDIEMPDVGDDSSIESEIVVAGTTVGAVSVTTLPAYVVPPKRGRKPKPAVTAEAAAAEAAAVAAYAAAAAAEEDKAAEADDGGSNGVIAAEAVE